VWYAVLVCKWSSSSDKLDPEHFGVKQLDDFVFAGSLFINSSWGILDYYIL